MKVLKVDFFRILANGEGKEVEAEILAHARGWLELPPKKNSTQSAQK